MVGNAAAAGSWDYPGRLAASMRHRAITAGRPAQSLRLPGHRGAQAVWGSDNRPLLDRAMAGVLLLVAVCCFRPGKLCKAKLPA